MAQRPMLLPGESLARCRHASISARRAYLGLPLRQDAPWADSSEICQRFAAFVLEGLLEEVEVQATRCIVFQPSAGQQDPACGVAGGNASDSTSDSTLILHSSGVGCMLPFGLHRDLALWPTCSAIAPTCFLAVVLTRLRHPLLPHPAHPQSATT